MFGSNKAPVTPPVPVYTVHTVPQPYEIVGTVSAYLTSEKNGSILAALGRQGADIGADAVIGLTGVMVGKIATVQWFGTAIRYIK